MNLTKISKKLSYLLRHCTEPLYIDLDNGWASTEEIIEVLCKKYPDVNITVLEQIVAADEKGRYSFNNDHTKIRANQGHSIPGVHIDMEQPEPPELLYHGTATRFFTYDPRRRSKAYVKTVCSYLIRFRNCYSDREEAWQACCDCYQSERLCQRWTPFI